MSGLACVLGFLAVCAVLGVSWAMLNDLDGDGPGGNEPPHSL